MKTFPRKLLYPPVVLIAITIFSIGLATYNNVLFGSKYAGIEFYTSNSLIWIAIFAFFFAWGGMVEFIVGKKYANVKNSGVSPLPISDYFNIYKRTWKAILLVSLVGLINAAWRWYISIEAAGGLSSALALIQSDSTYWRYFYVLRVNAWNGWFLPSELTPLLMCYSVIGLYLFDVIDWDDAVQTDLILLRNRLRLITIITLLITFSITLLLRDRLTMFGTFVPALFCLLVMVQRVPYKGVNRIQSRSRRRRQRAIAVIIVLVIVVSISNFASRGNRQTIAEALSLNYFITNLASTNFHIQHTNQFLYGLSSLREFFYVAGFSVDEQLRGAADSSIITVEQFRVVFNQAPSVFSYAWSDFGRFGLLYMFALGFISSYLYRKIWVTNSLRELLFGCFFSGVWVLSFHGLQLVLIEFWWNVFVLIVLFRRYAPAPVIQPKLPIDPSPATDPSPDYA